MDELPLLDAHDKDCNNWYNLSFHIHTVWLVTSEIRRKIQTFVNRRLRYILRIWWPKIISNKDIWRATGQEDINLEIKERK
jgi:hypothetical protein